MKKNLTISLNLKEDEELRQFINEMIVAQVKSISRELIKTVVTKHMEQAIEDCIEKNGSILRVLIAKIYEKERIDRYKELQASVKAETNKVVNEALINAKENINKALNDVVSEMVLNRLRPSKKKEVKNEHSI